MKNIERFGPFSGWVKLKYQDKDYYVVYAEPNGENMLEYIYEGYLGCGIGKGENLEESLKNAINNLNSYLSRYGNYMDYLESLLEENDIEFKYPNKTLEFDSIGLSICIKDVNNEISPSDNEQREMFETKSDAKIWIDPDGNPQLSPYP